MNTSNLSYTTSKTSTVHMFVTVESNKTCNVHTRTLQKVAQLMFQWYRL